MKTLSKVESFEREAITVPMTPRLGRPSPSSNGSVSNIPYHVRVQCQDNITTSVNVTTAMQHDMYMHAA